MAFTPPPVHTLLISMSHYIIFISGYWLRYQRTLRGTKKVTKYKENKKRSKENTAAMFGLLKLGTWDCLVWSFMVLHGNFLFLNGLSDKILI